MGDKAIVYVERAEMRKQRIAITLIFLIMGVRLVSLCACGNSNDSGEGIVGTWDFATGSVTGDEYWNSNIPIPITNEHELNPLDEGTAMDYGDDTHGFGCSEFSLEIEEDGIYNLLCFGTIESGTWTMVGDTIKFINSNGDEEYASYEESSDSRKGKCITFENVKGSDGVNWYIKQE